MLPSLLGARSWGWGENQERRGPWSLISGVKQHGWVRDGQPAPTQGRISYISQGPTWGLENRLGALVEAS